AVALRLPQVPQSRRARLGLELLDQRHGLPAGVAREVSVPSLLVRMDVLGREGHEPLPQLLHFRAVVEVHAALRRIFSTCFQPSSAIGRARLPASRACSDAAVPSTTRLAIPCRMAAIRNRL